MNKRGLSKIVENVLLIVLSIICVMFSIALVLIMVDEQSEVAKIKTELLARNVVVNKLSDMSQIPQEPLKYELTLTRGSDFQKVRSENIETTTPPTEVFSVVDVSKTMGECADSHIIYIKKCKYICNYTVPNVVPSRYTWCYIDNNPTVSALNCSDTYDICNIMLGKPQRAIQPRTNKTTYSNDERLYCYYYYLDPYNVTSRFDTCVYRNVDTFDNCSGDYCNTCKSPNNTYGHINLLETKVDYCSTKLNVSQTANKIFTNSIFEYPDNYLGLITYDLNTRLSSSLTRDRAAIISNITSWKINLSGQTNLCGAINFATEKFTTLDNRNRIIVLLTDGKANVLCDKQGTGNAVKDAIQASKEAYEKYKIKIFTIGLGLNIDSSTLQSMSSVSGGNFYPISDISKLEEAYKQIASSFTQYYSDKENLYMKVIFFNGTATEHVTLTDIPVQPMERKRYSINLNSIENVISVEAYLMEKTKDGKEIIGPIIYNWKATK